MLKKSFYLREDTLKIARELLGKYLLTDIDGMGITGGKIVETEAYLGAIDKASHGYNNLRTKRNENLYKEGGHAYVYLCYGMYYLFNVVTGKENTADAVLIRAIEPEIGIESMVRRKIENLKRRNAGKNKNITSGNLGNVAVVNNLANIGKLADRITSGPGLLTIALGIDLRHNGISIYKDNIDKSPKTGIKNYKNEIKEIKTEIEPEIWIEDRSIYLKESDIVETTRIGINYAAEHALLPWRFKIKDNKWVSK